MTDGPLSSRKRPVQTLERLIDFMEKQILEMSDEELLAETENPDEVCERVERIIRDALKIAHKRQLIRKRKAGLIRFEVRYHDNLYVWHPLLEETVRDRLRNTYKNLAIPGLIEDMKNKPGLEVRTAFATYRATVLEDTEGEKQ